MKNSLRFSLVELTFSSYVISTRVEQPKSNYGARDYMRPRLRSIYSIYVSLHQRVNKLQVNIWDYIYLNCKERRQDENDHQGYIHKIWGILGWVLHCSHILWQIPTCIWSFEIVLLCMHIVWLIQAHKEIVLLLQAYCVTEPGAGSDVAGIKTKAVKKGDEVRYTV